MNPERSPGRNPEDYEVSAPNPAEIVTQETSLLTKLRGKAQNLAKVLILFTSLSLGYSEEKKGSNAEKPGYTLEEVEKIKGDSARFLNNAKDFKGIPGLNLEKEISQARDQEPRVFLENAKYFKDISGLNLAQEIILTRIMDAHSFLNNAKDFKDIAGLNLAQEIIEAAKREPETFFENAKDLKSIPGLDLGQEITKTAEFYPKQLLKNAKDLKDIQGLNLAAEVLEAAKREPETFFKNAKYLKDIPGLDLGQEITKTAGFYPEQLLRNAKDLKDIQGLNLAAEILEAAETEPKTFFENAKDLKDIQGLNLSKEIITIAKNYPGVFLENAKDLKDIQGLNLAAEILEAAEKEPDYFLYYAKNFKDIQGLNLGKKIAEIGKINPKLLLLHARDYKDIQGLNLAAEVLEAAEKKPYIFLGYIKYFKDIFPENNDLSFLIEKIFKDNPDLINEYKLVLDSIQNPQLMSTKVLKKISDTETAILLNHMVKHGLSESDAKKIIENENNKFLQTLIEIKSESDHLGKGSIDDALKNICLQKVQKINELHEQPDAARFASVNKLTPTELYTLMVYGEEEVYTSSFNGLFSLLLNKIKKDNLSGKKLLEQVAQNKFRTFIKECSSFNRLNEFLDTMDKESAEQLLSSMVSNIDTAEDKLAQATIVADIFSTIQNEDILKVLQKQIKLEYERVNTSPEAKKEDKIIYGILSSMFAEKAVTNETWFKEMADKFKLENLTTLKSSDLFNTNNTNVQQYFFYDDEDGHASFKHFLSQYQNQPDWHVTKKYHFVLITQEKNGKSMEIYANYPTSEIGGPEAIDEILKEKKIETITVVHRGHSYHAQQTIDRIPPTAKIVSLGSCGGYSNLEQVLKKAPKAHVLSTKGTGTMFVNDPLLKNLNIEILSGKNIEWPTFWENMQKKLGNNSNFQDYISPHKNLGVKFLKTYFQELQK